MTDKKLENKLAFATNTIIKLKRENALMQQFIDDWLEIFPEMGPREVKLSMELIENRLSKHENIN